MDPGLPTKVDRFRKPMPGGYRDLLLLLRVCYHVCELQFNLEELIAIKESPKGHGAYENVRLWGDRALLSAMQHGLLPGKWPEPSLRMGMGGGRRS